MKVHTSDCLSLVMRGTINVRRLLKGADSIRADSSRGRQRSIENTYLLLSNLNRGSIKNTPSHAAPSMRVMNVKSPKRDNKGRLLSGTAMTEVQVDLSRDRKQAAQTVNIYAA